MLDEIDKGDLTDQINLFESKLDSIWEKAEFLLNKVETFESHNDKLPEILDKFRSITKEFEKGTYKKMIVVEL